MCFDACQVQLRLAARPLTHNYGSVYPALKFLSAGLRGITARLAACSVPGDKWKELKISLFIAAM